MQANRRDEAGFTLIEMMVVMVIIGLLMALVGPRFIRQAEVAKSNYTSILARLNDTTTVKAVEKIPLHPLDAAVPDGNPISPNKPAITRTCIGIGVLVFFGVAVGLSFIDDRIPLRTLAPFAVKRFLLPGKNPFQPQKKAQGVSRKSATRSAKAL